VRSVVFPLLGILLLETAWRSGNPRLLLLPPIAVNAALFYIFARSLLLDREALITGFHRYIHGQASEEVIRYTRRLTCLWVLYFGVSLTLVTMAARGWGDAALASGLSVGLPAAALVFFVGEHLFRARFLRHYGTVSLWHTLNKLRQPEAWRQAREGAAARR